MWRADREADMIRLIRIFHKYTNVPINVYTNDIT